MEQRKSTPDSENGSIREQPSVTLQQYKVGDVQDMQASENTHTCEYGPEGSRQKALDELWLCAFSQAGSYIFLLSLGIPLEVA